MSPPMTTDVAAICAHVEALQAEIHRLRGLLIDPGDPAWEDARAVLVTELRKAEMPDHARAVAQGEGCYIPSWMALNLIAHASRAAIQQNDEGVSTPPTPNKDEAR